MMRNQDIQAKHLAAGHRQYEEGFKDGYKEGVKKGYNKGYRQGILDARTKRTDHGTPTTDGEGRTEEGAG